MAASHRSATVGSAGRRSTSRSPHAPSHAPRPTPPILPVLLPRRWCEHTLYITHTCTRFRNCSRHGLHIRRDRPDTCANKADPQQVVLKRDFLIYTTFPW
jgi:hypothetical protein